MQVFMQMVSSAQVPMVSSAQVQMVSSAQVQMASSAQVNGLKINVYMAVTNWIAFVISCGHNGRRLLNLATNTPRQSYDVGLIIMIITVYYLIVIVLLQ
jgi:hypothetical protein